jgi:antitoxin component YwqK of YwqJK toxin-antitoxin module
MAKSLKIDIEDTYTEYIAGNPTKMFEDKPFTGITFELKNGQVIEEVTYLDGAEHGSAKSWYPNGNLEYVGEHKWNLHHGPFETWYESGSLQHKGFFELGHAIWRKEWDEAGNLISEESIEDDSDEVLSLEAMRSAFKRLGVY